MPSQRITVDDVVNWDTLQDIANSFEKQGLEPLPDLGKEYEFVLRLGEDEFIVLIDADAGPSESPVDYKPDNSAKHTNLIVTNNFEEFTILTRSRTWEGEDHGQITHQVYSFTKEEMRKHREQQDILTQLNSIEHGSPTST
jgi:hypothetical protein